jgi:dTMP kinase
VSGLFITFEGPDGAGKSTQLQRLASFLENKDIAILCTREPGGTNISDQIRHIILHPEHKEMVEKAEILLYAASRAQHVKEKIKPALEEGKIVLCDRFVDASVAYQGYGLGYGEDKILQINDFATGGLTPDRTYMIDLPPEKGRARMSSRKNNEFEQELDRIEQKEIQYHKQVRHGFHQLSQDNDRILLIDGQQSIEKIHDIINKDITHLLETKLGLST